MTQHTVAIDAFCDAITDISEHATNEQREQLRSATGTLIEALAHAAASQSAGVAIAFVARLRVLEQREVALTQRLEALEQREAGR